MKKQPTVTAATRAAFIEAYYDLAEKKEHKKITVGELADRVGYNRTTFYEYFRDINHLLSAIEDDMLECIKSKILSQFGNAELDKVFVSVFTELYREYDRPLRLLFSEANAPRFSHRIKQRLIPIFSEVLHKNLENPETVYFLEFYLSGILSVIGRWFSREDDLSLEEFAGIMKSIVDGMGKSGLLS